MSLSRQKVRRRSMTVNKMFLVRVMAMPSAEMPFGEHKDSGYDSEGGPEALEAYLNTHYVAISNA